MYENNFHMGYLQNLLQIHDFFFTTMLQFYKYSDNHCRLSLGRNWTVICLIINSNLYLTATKSILKKKVAKDNKRIIFSYFQYLRPWKKHKLVLYPLRYKIHTMQLAISFCSKKKKDVRVSFPYFFNRKKKSIL